MNIPMHSKESPRTVPAAVRRGDPPPGARAAAAPSTRPGGATRADASRPAVGSGWAASPATGRAVGSAGRVASGAAAAAKPPSRGSTWNELPSSRLKSVKCSDPFATKSSQFKTNFANVYSAGGIPVRLNHGAVNIKLQWGKEVLLPSSPLRLLVPSVTKGDIHSAIRRRSQRGRTPSTPSACWFNSMSPLHPTALPPRLIP